MKFQVTLKPHQPLAGALKIQLRTIILTALLFILLLPMRLLGQTEPSALLELQSTDKGFLLPRLTQAQRDAVVNPATGLMIYNTSANCLQINYGSPSTPSWFPLGCSGTVGMIGCSGANVMGTLISGQAASGVSASVPYTGGDGGTYPGQVVSSTGVTGLTATLAAGSFASGGGNVTYAITGTPAAPGTASFALNIGGQSCILNAVVFCRAYVAADQWKVFMCHNLAAANTSANPLTPSWEINGGYWQWGHLGPNPSQWLNTNSPNFAHGPTGSGSMLANQGNISGWNTENAPNGAWSDATKTANDPCPQGFRVPTKAQWDGVLANNTQSVTGTWTESATNYSNGRFFGTDLMLPAAGYRNISDGALVDRGEFGDYWSSKESGTDDAHALNFGCCGALTFNFSRRHGFSLRCIAEDVVGSIGMLDCSGTVVVGTLTSGQLASGVSASIPYSGGNGGTHNGQITSSSGVTGLTATLTAGNFATGAGTLSYTISGTPSGYGTANFSLNIGGQSCTLSIPVSTGCRAKVNATNYKDFLCHNLAAANTSADPFTPSWEINGGYWQWGRAAMAAPGPSGPGAGEANDGPISGWNTENAPNGAWSDTTKTANDPCPQGFRVPTMAQWDDVLSNNTQSVIGTWTESATNYSSGRFFGPDLMLPAAGDRDYLEGELFGRGDVGYYRSSSVNGSDTTWNLYFFSSGAYMDGSRFRLNGFSLRCIAE